MGATLARRCVLLLGILGLGLLLTRPAVHGAQSGAEQPDARHVEQLRAAVAEHGTARVIVRTRPAGGSSAATQNAAVSAMVSSPLRRTVRSYRSSPYAAMTVDQETLERLAASPDVEGIFEDVAVQPTLFSSGPLVGASSARRRGYGGAGWSIAIVDTGIEQSHPFLRGKVVAEGCWDSGSQSCSSSGGAAVSVAAIGPGTGAACDGAGCSHGTHVAGIASGNGAGAGVAFSGIAADASLIAIRVFDSSGSTAYTSDIDAALQYIYDLRNTYHIAAVNLSLGSSSGYTSPCDADVPSTKAMIDQLRSAGIATVIASGNNGFTNAISIPACISSAISVGSTINPGWGMTDRVSLFSNSSPFLSLLAPGQAIFSSVRGGGYDNLQGTSMAAPHVAGAWAVMKQASPNASVSDVLDWLRGNGKPVQDARNGVTVPRLQLDQALYSITPASDLQPILLNYNGDDDKDVLLYNRTTGSWVIEIGGPDGQFVDGPSGGWSPGWAIHVADFNNDGLDDLFLYSPQTGVWYKAINDGLSFEYFSQGWQSGLRVFTVDLNGDGKSDVFAYNPTSGAWFTCISAGDGTAGFDYGTGQWAPGWHVFPADFDGDGRSDFLLYDPITGAYYKAITRGNGVFAYTSFTTAPGGAWAPGWSPLVADLNGDGLSDVFLYNVNNGVWYRCISTGDGTADFDYTVGQWAAGWTVQAADFDNDHLTDLFLYRSDGVWYKALNTGSGFTYKVGVWGKWTTTVSDLNGDHKSDLFLYDRGTGLSYQALTTVPSGFTYTRARFR